MDQMRQKKAAEDSRNQIVRYHEGDQVCHPRYGQGTVEKATQLQGAVRLTIRFADGVHVIDQKWLVQHTDARFQAPPYPAKSSK